MKRTEQRIQLLNVITGASSLMSVARKNKELQEKLLDIVRNANFVFEELAL
jgi:hypothetical protein